MKAIKQKKVYGSMDYGKLDKEKVTNLGKIESREG